MTAKNVSTVPQETAPPPYCNINIKGATLGDSYAVYLNGSFKRTFGGTITEENFSIGIPPEKLKTIVLEINPQKGKTIRKDIPPNENTDILLKPVSEIRNDSGGNKFQTGSIREMLASRKPEAHLPGGVAPLQDLRPAAHLEGGAEEVQKKKEQEPKKGFWDRLK